MMHPNSTDNLVQGLGSGCAHAVLWS